MFRAVIGVIAVIVTAASGVSAQRPEPTLVLAELFTSQGCSSCPSADHLLETLIKEQPIAGVHVVALSEHVTYWDHQGWKDPFASKQFTNRQKMYGFGFNLDSIYTPQLVIDGVSEVVGSDERRIRGLLTSAARTPKPQLGVKASLRPGGNVQTTVSGPGLSLVAGDAELWFAITEDNLVVDVTRGENAKRTLRHSGVVRVLTSERLERTSIDGPPFKLRLDWNREHLRVVAFVQSKKTRRVLSIGYAAVR